MTTPRSNTLAPPKRAVGGFAAAAILSIGLAAPAYATNTVSQSLTGGSRSASSPGLAFGSVGSSTSEQSATGTLTLIIDDSSGTGAGWDVTIQASAFAYAGPHAGSAIPASSLWVGTPASPVTTVGQAVDRMNGPLAVTAGSLDVPRTVTHANRNYGLGAYTQSIPVALRVPAQARPGTYTSTLSIVIAAAAGSTAPEPRFQLAHSVLVIEITEAQIQPQVVLAPVADADPVATDNGVRSTDDPAPTRPRSAADSPLRRTCCWPI